jgi:hypothetical protein
MFLWPGYCLVTNARLWSAVGRTRRACSPDVPCYAAWSAMGHRKSKFRCMPVPFCSARFCMTFIMKPGVGRGSMSKATLCRPLKLFFRGLSITEMSKTSHTYLGPPLHDHTRPGSGSLNSVVICIPRERHLLYEPGTGLQLYGRNLRSGWSLSAEPAGPVVTSVLVKKIGDGWCYCRVCLGTRHFDILPWMRDRDLR